jgi:hypothetical protein
VARERDTRRIVRGVQFVEHGDPVTYVAGDEDLLEEVLTPERGKQLLEAGDLEGDGWKFAGEPAPPMAGSRLQRARAAGPEAVKALEAEEERRARVRAMGPKEARRLALEERQAKEAAEGEKLRQQRIAETEKEHEQAAKEQQKAEQKAAHGHAKGK